MKGDAIQEFAVHQEDDLVAGRKLAIIGAGSVVVGAVGVIVAALLVYRDTGALRPSAAGLRGPLPAPTAISRVEQTPIWQTRAGLDTKAAQQAELNHLKWLDREAGIAQIPIDDAIDIVVQVSR